MPDLWQFFVRDATGPDNQDGRSQFLAFGWCPLDGTYDIKSADHAAKSGKSLAIGIASATEIKLRLVTYANKEI